MKNDLVLLTRAFHFAARKHEHQRRKGTRAEPYVNHLAEVTRLLAEATEGRDVVLLLGGLLHDTVEDTEATLGEIEERFGAEVAALVAEVTDDKALPKEERKHRQVETACGKSERARLLKIADKTSNLRSLIQSPPEGWSLERKQQYVLWAGQVVAGCRGLNLHLDEVFEKTFRKGLEVFGVELPR